MYPPLRVLSPKDMRIRTGVQMIYLGYPKYFLEFYDGDKPPLFPRS